MHDLTNPRTLVLDLGTATPKSGWTEFGEPDLTVPSVVGRGRHKGAMLTLGLKDSYVGRQAQSLQGILSLRQPFRGGCVQHWDDLELLWDHVWWEFDVQKINFWQVFFRKWFLTVMCSWNVQLKCKKTSSNQAFIKTVRRVFANIFYYKLMSNSNDPWFPGPTNVKSWTKGRRTRRITLIRADITFSYPFLRFVHRRTGDVWRSCSSKAPESEEFICQTNPFCPCTEEAEPLVTFLR